MPNKKKLYEALRDEGYDNFADEKSFKDYVDNPINRRKLFNALKNEGYDNFEDINDFNKYLGYDKPYTHEYDESGKLVGGTAYKDSEPSRYEYKPEVQQYILDHKPDMFKPKTVDMYGAHDKDKTEWDLMNEGKLYEMQDARQRYLQRPITSFGESFEQGADALYQGGKNLVGEVSNLATGSQRDYERARLQLDELIQSGYDLTNFDSKKALKDYKDREYQRKYDEWQKDIATRKEEREGMGFFDALLHRIKDPSRPKSQYEETGNLADEVQLARSYTAIQEALQKTNGNVDEAYKLLGKESSKETWGDKISREARAELAKQRPTEGFAAWAGGMLPQMIGTGAGIVASLNPYTRWLSPLLGRANMALLTGATSGMSMAEARDYGASEGDIWKTGIIDAAIEYGTEKLPFERYFGKIQNATKSVIGKSIAKATVDNDAVQNELSELLQRVGKEFGAGLFSKKNISEYLKDVGTEGVSEFMAEALQTISPMVYQNPEDYPTLMEILESGWEGAKGGLFMGAFLGAGSKYSANRIHNQRRKSQGNVTFADTNIGVVEILDEKDGVTSVLDDNGEVHKISSDEIKEKATISYNDFVNGSYQKEASDIEDAYNDGVLLETPYDKHNAKRAVDRAEADLGVGSENSDEQQFAQMVMAGANSPVETINAMAEQGYSDEQIQKAKDYYTAYHRMNGLTDALLDNVNSQIESANREVDANTNMNEDTQERTIVPVTLRDGRQGYVIQGTIVTGEKGNIDIGNSDSYIVVRVDGENLPMNPNKDLVSVGQITTPEALKEYNNTELKRKLIDKGIGEIDWNPATPNPKVGDSFEMEGVPLTIVSHDGNGGMFVVPTDEYQSAVGSEKKMQELIAKAQQTQPIPASEYKNWASAQLDAQEEAAKVQQEIASSESVGEQVNAGVNVPVNTGTQQPVAEKRPMTEDEAASFIFQMERNAVEAPEIELTPENWIAEFGEDGLVETPIGQVKFGQSQYVKLQQMGRRGKLGMIKPTLTEPDVIIEDKRPSKDGSHERDFSYVFIKAFTGKDGKRMYYFTSVTIKKGGSEVVISNQEKSLNKISRLLQGGNVVWTNPLFSSHPTTRIEESVPLNDSNKPTSTDNQSAWLGINSSELSTNKDSEKNVQKQEKEQKPLHEREKEDVFRELGEKYGEKMPHKVEVTAKAVADDLKKAQEKLDKAQEAYDNAPIGREEKAEKVRDKAQQELDAIKREADFWAEMDAEIKSAQMRRSEILNPQAEIEASNEPMTADEFVAQQLTAGNIVLNKDDYMRETGFGNEEANAMNGGAKKLFGANGMTIQKAGERLMEMDRENGTNFFDQSDSNAGRDALISVLGSVKSRKELNQYIAENRKSQAEKAVWENYHISLEEFVARMEADELNNPYDGVDLAAIDAIFAEAELERESLNEQENESGRNVEGNQGQSELLSESQSDNEGGSGESEIERRADEAGGESQNDGETAQSGTSGRQAIDVLAEAERIHNEEIRRRPLRERVKEWENLLGVKVNVIERPEDVKNGEALRYMAQGQTPSGWVESNGEVCIYLPGIPNVAEIDKTIIHEVVAHRGLKGLLGRERFNELCDKVWQMMPDSKKREYFDYVGNRFANEQERQRAAADEYMAFLAEGVDITPQDQSVWKEIIKYIRSVIDSVMGKTSLTDADIEELLRASFARLVAYKQVADARGGRTMFKFSKTPQEFDAVQKEAVEKKGIVMPGLNEAVVDVLGIDKHSFDGNLKQAREAAKQWAIENYQGKEFSLPDNGGSYTIGKKAINKYVDKTSIDKSDNAIIHLSALKVLPNIISSSIIGEIHADYKKGENGKRSADNGVGDKGLLVHRMFGAVELDGKVYRVKTTMNEYRDPMANNTPHSYEVTEIELIESSSTPSLKDDSKPVNVSNNSITVANLLNGVEKSYDKGKKLLSESEKTRFRVAYHGSAADFDKFDHSFMGTGAGSQVFGWGTYLTESDVIGRDYANVTREATDDDIKYLGDFSEYVGNDVITTAKSFLRDADYNLEKAKEIVNDYLSKNVPEHTRKSGEFLLGTNEDDWAYNLRRHLYEVEIPDAKRGNYIIYGNNVTDAAAKKVFDGIYNRLSKTEEYDNPTAKKELKRELDDLKSGYGQGQSGIWKDLYGDISYYLGSDKEASLFLRSLGYVGIKYPAGTIYQGDYGGASNYVIFDENDLHIVNHTRFRMTNAEKEELRDSEETKALFDYAKKRFGRTFDLREAGYILPDGAMLDFSGRHEMKPGSDTSHLAGYRSVDHRYVADLNYEPEDDGGEKTGFKTDMADFINRGAIRMDGNIGSINLTMKPTPKQKTILQRLIQRMDGDVWVDFGEGWNTEHSAEYSGVRPIRVLSDIDKYYDEGIKPEGNTRFRIANQNQEIFVSNAQRAVEGIKQEKGTPLQWLAMIEKNSGLKAGEDKWLGLSDWLKGSDKKSITKAEILDFIGENKIRIEEVHYSGSGMYDEWYQEDVFDAVSKSVAESKGIEFRDDFMSAFEIEYDDYVERVNVDIADDELAAKLYLQENENDIEFDEDGYLERNSVSKVRSWGDTIVSDAMKPNEGDKSINATRLNYTTEGLENKAEIALTVPTIESWNEDDEIHFGDAGEGRAIAWVRFGETTAPQADFEKAAREADGALTAYQNELADKYMEDGGSGDPTEYLDMMNEEEIKKMRELSGKMIETRDEANANQVRVLVIDEIQSKRHQEGREQGYAAKGMSENLKRIEQEMLNANENERQKERIFQDYVEELASKYGSVLSNYTEEENQKLKTLSDNWIEARRRARDLNGAYDKAVKELSGVPEAPFEKNWSELAFKRMLRYAAENGYDKVAWTTGAQQAERYSLSNVIDSISISKSRKEDGKYHVTSWDKETMPISVASGNKTPEELKVLFGKEIAQSLIEGVDNLEEGSDTFVLEGADLEVGGEGMKGFYDKMLPSFVNKYVKKWGAKVQDIELPNVEEAGRIMHSVDVTDAMKESVMEGQTMFRIADSDKQKQIDEEYVGAVRKGDFGKAIKLFREYVLSKAEENGVVPIDYGVGYRSHSHSSIAKKVKEENPDAISEAAYQMSKRVPKGSILVPMPSRSGKATYTIKLAEAIAKATESEVRDVLKGNERMSVYEAKKKGLKIDSRDLGFYVTENLPKDKNVVIIDNVIDRGITALAAVEAVDGGSVLAYAFTEGSKDRVVPLKLSDPITYDDELRIIPLSERFNSATNDLRFRIAKEPAVAYATQSEAEDIVDVPRNEVKYTMNNIGTELYKVSGDYMRELYKNGTLGRVLRGEFAEIDQIKAKYDYEKAKKHLGEYLNELVWMKYQATDAAQDVINDVIRDVEYSLDYYRDLSLGKDVWRTKQSPRFRIVDEKSKAIQKEVDKFTSKYNSKPVFVLDTVIKDKDLEDIFDGKITAKELREVLNKPNAIGSYVNNLDKIIIFADKVKVEKMENILFHENVHAQASTGKYNRLISYLYEYGKDNEAFARWKRMSDRKEYKEYQRPEEFLAYTLADGMNRGELEDVLNILEPSEKESLFNLFNELNYEYKEESRRRRLDRSLSGERSDNEGLKRTDRPENEGREETERISARKQAERLTALFEQVADMGLTGVVSDADYNRLMYAIFREMPQDEREEISLNAVKNLNIDVAKAVSDYLNTSENATFWKKVVGMFRDILRKVGFDINLTKGDVKYLLWRSKKPLNRKLPLDMAEDIDARRKFGVDVVSAPATRFRVNVSNKAKVRDDYEAMTKKSGYQAREAIQDAMLSLRRFQELLEKATGKAIRGFENAWWHENRMSSMTQSAIHEMERKFYKPMTKVVKKLMEKANMSEFAVADYLMLKHGIERNREMAVRKALTDEHGKIDRDKLNDWYEEKRRIRNDDSLDTWRKKQEAMDDAALMFGADMSRDYSGLTSMFDTDDLADCTERAYNEVEALENAHPKETEAVGKAVKAMTQSSLDYAYESGLMDKKVYDELSNDMYDYYIPLRGFDETTSDEVYAYMDNERGAFNVPLRRAKGRSSKADNPLAYMKSIAESGIMQGSRNKMKQSFLAMVLNRPSDLVSVKEGVWAVLNPATGEWEAASVPPIPDNATPADVEAIMKNWDEQMEQRAQLDPDNVRKITEADDVPYRVVGNRINQHQVLVKWNGKSYTLTVNGNPRLAMALNGLTNPNNTSNDGKVAASVQKAVNNINRQLAAWYTTRNPDFVASNFMRDTFYTNTIVRAKEGNHYANHYHKHYAKLLMPGKMLGLFNKWENGTLDMSNPMERDFYEFMVNGGETGYSNLKDMEEIKKQISKDLKGKRFEKVEEVLEMLDRVNRAVENTARFAAFRTSKQVGRTTARAIFDAKEISVNFNKKGAGGTFYKGVGQTGIGNLAAMVGAGGRALYVFFNAAIQGTTNLMHVMKKNPKGTGAGCAAMFLMGAIAPMLLGDDDEKDYYDLPEHVRRNHLILPGTGVAWVSIPLPIEYRIMYGAGELLTSWRTGHEKGRDIGRKMLNLTGQALPLNFLEEGVDAFIPSSLSPLWQVYNNKSWTGLPIYKDNEFNKDDPEYTKAYKNVNRGVYNVTKALYEWTFDEASQEEGINLNPAVIEHLAKGYFGGMVTTLDNLWKTGEMIAGDRDFDWRNIPIGNRALKTGDERTKEKRVTNEYFDNIERLDFLQSRERMIRKTIAGAAVPEEDKEKARNDYQSLLKSETYRDYIRFKEMKKDIDKLRKAMKEQGASDELNKRLNAMMESANKLISE